MSNETMTREQAEAWLRERRGHVLWRAEHVPQNAFGFRDEGEEPSYTICCAIGLLIVLVLVYRDDDSAQLFTISKASEIEAFMRDNDVYSLGGGKRARAAK